MLYMQYQQCSQGQRSVNDYTEEFYHLSARNNLNENTNQLVARYIGGLKETIQDKLELNSVWSLSQAVNYALKVEMQLQRHSRPTSSRRNTEQTVDSARQSYSNANQNLKQPITNAGSGGSSSAAAKAIDPKTVQKFRSPLARENPYAKPTSIKCFSCFQQGHKSNECPTRPQLQLVDAEAEDGEDEAEVEANNQVEDVSGDVGEPLMCVLEKLLLAPKQPCKSQRNALFRTKCTIGGKVCDLLIDSGCTENVVSRSMVQALQLKTTKNPNPYKISWVKKGVELTVTDLCKVSFSIRKYYASEVLCDVLEMDVCHVILGRPWQYDVGAIYDGRANTYAFDWKGRRLRLLPNAGQDAKVPQGNNALHSVSVAAMMTAWKETSSILALIVKEVAENTSMAKAPVDLQKLIEEFNDVCSERQLMELPPMRTIQHKIDLIPGASLLNLPHYRLSPNENKILQNIVDELLDKQLIQHSLSPCAVPVLLVPKKDGNWRMCMDSRAINKIIVKFRFPMP
ncbi:hypothetical protein KFK09_002929 [Dendrobium nobile]|uniref:CCHC-type domain-containing protein n=1 Tax=Dendrobium nobile TaxID=94219 RepID=A0A8T3C5A1_DENNO|nr:hypothetical protein KFK09_002929 [Dendrobium nobile]